MDFLQPTDPVHTKRTLPLLISLLGLLLIAAAVSISPARAQNDLTGDPERGGQLYVAWDLLIANAPNVDKHPLWPANTPNDIPTRRTWRCVSCHGWDYRGSEGFSLAGMVKAQEYPSLFSYVDEPESIIIPWLDGSINPEHDFSSFLSPTDLSDLSAFISRGMIAPAFIADLGTFEVQGTLNVGKDYYDQYCANCHGIEGEKINFGSTNNPAFIGDVAWINPWRIAHTLRYGHTNTNVPPASQIPLSFSQQIDLLAYSQTLPNARVIVPPQEQDIDFDSQADTAPLAYLAIAMAALVFIAVIWETKFSALSK